MRQGFQKVLEIKPPRDFHTFRGFCIWGDDPMTTEGFKRKLTAILSAEVKGSSSRLMCECGVEAFGTPSKINDYSLMV